MAKKLMCGAKRQISQSRARNNSLGITIVGHLVNPATTNYKLPREYVRPSQILGRGAHHFIRGRIIQASLQDHVLGIDLLTNSRLKETVLNKARANELARKPAPKPIRLSPQLLHGAMKSKHRGKCQLPQTLKIIGFVHF